LSEVASPTAINSNCGSAIWHALSSFMKVGNSWRASKLGISPMEPVTSSANAIPKELGVICAVP